MSEVEIYYFSGTGNSLYIAKELQKLIPNASLKSIAGQLKKDVIETRTDTIGFVFPIHGMTIPIPVRNFIKKINLKSTSYIFSIITRGGTKCFAVSEIEKILKKKNRKLDSFFIQTMLNNDPKLDSFEIPTNEEILALETKIQKRLEIIKKTIVKKEKYRKKDTDYVTFPFIKPVTFLLERLVLLGTRYAEYDGAKNYFYSDSRCKSCGTCEKVCQSGKIKMVDGKPLWQKDIKCYLCYACLNYCPSESVQIKSQWFMKSHTRTKGRYPHPFATAKDVAAQRY